jgi:ribose/xylose/arabinose/galactoside ABC-type transport system permease subunit
MSFVISGLASLVTSGNLIIAYSRPGFADLARTTFLTVNTSTWIMVAAVGLMGVVLSRTTAGRYMYAAAATPRRPGWPASASSSSSSAPSSSAAVPPRSAG